MITRPFEGPRETEGKDIQTDLCIVGGGLAGTCCAITAAREGLQVVLIQDRPVLGGNASSEVRLWALGASAHNHNNNRWAREGGAIDEILVENMHRNPEGNPIVFDTILLEKVISEQNITLLLNTTAMDVHCDNAVPRNITEVGAYCSQNETRYRIKPKYVVDSSGDGLIAYTAGLPFRFGAESSDEFGEGFAPDPLEYGELLGHSIFFMTKDTGKPVQFHPPAYALQSVTERIPRHKNFSVNDQGCEFWWIEYGGRLDTIHDTEKIKWELWSIVLGVWDHLKNSGEHPEAECLSLEWVGHIPGKRESRRFEGITMLTQDDLVQQRHYADAVSFGGWSIDLHPSDGVYTARPGCDQYHTKGVYQIPLSTMITSHAGNLFLAGRIISTSHVAFGSTRVMCTCAHNAQAVAVAASLAVERGQSVVDLLQDDAVSEIRRRLVRRGQHIPGYQLQEAENLAGEALLTATSVLSIAKGLRPATAEHAWRNLGYDIPETFDEMVPGAGGVAAPSIPAYGVYQRVASGRAPRECRFPEVPWLRSLHRSVAQMIPAQAGPIPELRFAATVLENTVLEVELRISFQPENYTPDTVLETIQIPLEAGLNKDVAVRTNAELPTDCYLYAVFNINNAIALRTRPERVTGLFSLEYTGEQEPPLEWGIEGFEIWTPERRPGGHLIAFELGDPEYYPGAFSPENTINGFQRPSAGPNAWVVAVEDPEPVLILKWDEPQTIRTLELVFDTDYNHPMETVIRGHPERNMPFCVKHFVVLDSSGKQLAEETDWYQSRYATTFTSPVITNRLEIRVKEMNGHAPAAIFDVRVYAR
ncbi:MAG: FAD-dependent oxidoreductase [Spirochaetaceae bacterium]|nr:MAG: FAD-dependent oxidoreductase [Spirochaetaceae bacterium]